MIRSRRLLALALLASAVLVPSGSPAAAVPGAPVEVNLFLRNFTLPEDGPAVDDDLSVFLTSDRAGWANEVTLSVDTSALAAVADVVVTAAEPEVTCTKAGSVVRCTVPGPHQVIRIPDRGGFSVFTSPSALLSLRPKPGATAGDTGVLTVTARADDGPTATRTSRIRIGEGVNLTAIDTPSPSVPPGGSASVRPAVRNAGTREVQGVNLALTGDSALARTNFGNCTYGEIVTCAFDTALAAGRTYRVSAPFTVRTPKDAVTGSETGASVQWLTRADWQDWLGRWKDTAEVRQGTGPDLKLNELPAATAAEVPQADTDGDDNGSTFSVTVRGGRKTDVVAVGASVTGSPGEVRTIEVGLVNRGPGTLQSPPFFNNLPGIYVTLPPGLSLVRADERCQPLFVNDPAPPPSWSTDEPLPSGAPFAARAQFAPGPLEVLCRAGSVRLRPGQRLSFTFTVKIAPGAGQGTVEVLLYDDGENAVDRNPGNNSAPITVTRAGGLPITGPTTATIGLLLVLAGAAVTVALRRRVRSKAG